MSLSSVSAPKRKPLPVDPTLSNVLDHIAHMSPREVAEGSGRVGLTTWVSPSTIVSWRKGKVRRPANYTIDAALRAAGLERVIQKRK